MPNRVWIAVPVDEILWGLCPACGTDQPLLGPDDLRAHLGSDGEYCPGSRGAPVGGDHP